MFVSVVHYKWIVSADREIETEEKRENAIPDSQLLLVLRGGIFAIYITYRDDGSINFPPPSFIHLRLEPNNFTSCHYPKPWIFGSILPQLFIFKSKDQLLYSFYNI